MQWLLPLAQKYAAARARWQILTLYQRFERAIVLLLTALIAIVIIAAVWNVVLKVFAGLVLGGSFDPTHQAAFQKVFGMIFTVMIALEFKRSLLVLAHRTDTIVQVRSVILIGLLTIVRKLIIMDLGTASAAIVFALTAATLSLGVVYWLIRGQDFDSGGRSPAARRARRATSHTRRLPTPVPHEPDEKARDRPSI